MGGALRLQSRGRLRHEPFGCTAFPPACRSPGRIRHVHVAHAAFQAQRLLAAGRDSIATFLQMSLHDPAMRFMRSCLRLGDPHGDRGPPHVTQPSSGQDHDWSSMERTFDPTRRDLQASPPEPLPLQCVARRSHRRGGVRCPDCARAPLPCPADCGPGTGQACRHLRKSPLHRS